MTVLDLKYSWNSPQRREGAKKKDFMDFAGTQKLYFFFFNATIFLTVRLCVSAVYELFKWKDVM
jgi:hypothetical protein